MDYRYIFTPMIRSCTTPAVLLKPQNYRHGSRIPSMQLPASFQTSRHGDIYARRQHHKFTTGRTRHPLSNTRRPGVPCRRCTCLERSSTLSDICIDTSYFSTIFKDTSIPSQLLFVVLFLVLCSLFVTFLYVPLKRFP